MGQMVRFPLAKCLLHPEGAESTGTKSCSSLWVTSATVLSGAVPQPPNTGGFACALQAGKPKCCGHACKENQYWRQTQVQNIHLPLHLLHLKVISP